MSTHLYNREQSAHPSLRAAEGFPATNVDSSLDEANGSESTLATSAIQVGGNASLELVHKHGSLRRIAFGFRILRGG